MIESRSMNIAGDAFLFVLSIRLCNSFQICSLEAGENLEKMDLLRFVKSELASWSVVFSQLFGACSTVAAGSDSEPLNGAL